MSTSILQDQQQAMGPHRPSVSLLLVMLESIPSHLEIEAIAINGQTGKIVVETYHEGLTQTHEFVNP